MEEPESKAAKAFGQVVKQIEENRGLSLAGLAKNHLIDSLLQSLEEE